MDEYDLSDISLDISATDISMEADDSGIDACDVVRRPIRNYPDIESSSESNGEEDLLIGRINFGNRIKLDNDVIIGEKKFVTLYGPITVEPMQILDRIGDSEDDQSILEVELTASGEDDDSSAMELVIPLQSKKGPGLGVFRLICNFFCCKPLE